MDLIVSRVALLISSLSFKALETVDIEYPDIKEICFIVIAADFNSYDLKSLMMLNAFLVSDSILAKS